MLLVALLAAALPAEAEVRVELPGVPQPVYLGAAVLADRPVTTEQRVTPHADGVRWDVTIPADGAAWTAPVVTWLRWPGVPGLRFWTAWGSPNPAQPGWQDPLVPQPLGELALRYGGDNHVTPAAFSLPVACLLDVANGHAVSLVFSPEDLNLDVRLLTRPDGTLLLRREGHRLGVGPVRFTMDVIVHAADWRPALGWLAASYPESVDPPVPTVGQLAGCGAYSRWEGELDVAKLLGMSFGLNWNASFDFPYMGMFLPPLPLDEQWTRFGGGQTSIRQMADYAQRMRDSGFSVLSYFNVTEFGARIPFPAPPRSIEREQDLWRDGAQFLYYAVPDALLTRADGTPYGSWEGAVAVDPGDPKYREFLLDQARRHVAELPASAGICIDRMDWLRLYNPRADDGASMAGGAPARSLVVSWHELMARLGPIVHDAGKVIFGNPHYRRLDLTRQLDGIYDEFGQIPASANLCALLCLRKPSLAWTASVDDLRPDPDAFLQRYLHLGSFPTAPFPQNDHTINADAWAERYYLDYGPLFDTLRDRRWVLTADPVTVADSAARANLFEIPGGYVAMLTGGTAETVRVTLRGLTAPDALAAWRVDLRHPGAAAWSELPSVAPDDAITIDVPLERGCAAVRLLGFWMTPDSRAMFGPRTVDLGTAVTGATLRYTLDGSEPAAASPEYRGPFELTATTWVKAALFNGPRRVSAVLSRWFVRCRPSPPRLAPEREVFDDEITVTLAGDGPIHFTLDGSEPTAASPRYQAPVALRETTVVRARVIAPGGESSPVTSRTYVRRPPAPPAPDIALGDLTPVSATAGWGGAPRTNQSIQERPLSLGGRVYESGVGTHAHSELVYDVDPGWGTFVAIVGLDDEMNEFGLGTVRFRVLIDAAPAAESPLLRQGDIWHLAVPIPAGARRITLIADDGGDGIHGDHADWVAAGFVRRR